MYKCLKCNKEFKYESKLNEHKNRKIPCNSLKKEYMCELCKLIFTRPSHQKIHEQTKSHINKSIKTIIINDNNLENKSNVLENEIINLQNKNNTLNEEIINLKNKIINLEVENMELKNKNRINNNVEYIYIIHPIQCINMNVYKIGRTNNIINRYKQYPKGSELLFNIICKDSKEIEKIILNNLKSNNNYIQIKKYGSEYFQCDLNYLINDITNIISNKKIIE